MRSNPFPETMLQALDQIKGLNFLRTTAALGRREGPPASETRTWGPLPSLHFQSGDQHLDPPFPSCRCLCNDRI